MSTTSQPQAGTDAAPLQTAYIELQKNNEDALLKFHYENSASTRLVQHPAADGKSFFGPASVREATHLEITFYPETYVAFGKAFGLKKKRGE